MNNITLRGILKDIKPSHKINNIEYDQANLIVPRTDGKEDIISLKFKKFCNKYTEGSNVELSGNLRSYSQRINSDKNKVSLYVFTYFDIPEMEDNNSVCVDGRICKIDTLRTTRNGKTNIHFILANNLIINESNQKLNSYIPCIAWGKTAKELSELHVNDKILIEGEIHSREYKKILDNGEFEFRVAHECVVTSFQLI